MLQVDLVALLVNPYLTNYGLHIFTRLLLLVLVVLFLLLVLGLELHLLLFLAFSVYHLVEAI
jgi:hypothetical protein